MALLLRQYREKMNISQVELSARSGIPQQTISNIEKGDRKNVGVQTLYPLCTVLNCTIDDLYVPEHSDSEVQADG